MSFKCCHKCVQPKRYPGCHDHCPDYKEERAEYDRRKAIEDRKKQIAQGLYEQRRVAVTKASRHSRKGKDKVEQ